LFNFLMIKLIKQLSKFKYLKCFLSHHALWFLLIFIYIHSFGNSFYLWAKAQDFTLVFCDVYFQVNCNENLLPGTVQLQCVCRYHSQLLSSQATTRVDTDRASQ
jgi:hypothetical protein